VRVVHCEWQERQWPVESRTFSVLWMYGTDRRMSVKKGKLRIGTSGDHSDYWQEVFSPRNLPTKSWFASYASFRYRGDQQHVLPSAPGSALRSVTGAGPAALPLCAEVQPLWFTPEASERASCVDRESPRPGESAPRVSWPYPCPIATSLDSGSHSLCQFPPGCTERLALGHRIS
jgi:hypothetical protein